MLRPYATPFVAMLLVSLLTSSCASVEPDWNIDPDASSPDVDAPDSDQPDMGLPDVDPADAGDDADVAPEDDADTTEPPPPCDDLCGPNEQCRDDVCVDLCVEAGFACGEHALAGQAVSCGTCELGACQEGQCVDVCGEVGAECGDLYIDGTLYSCASCAGAERCAPNNLCVANQLNVDLTAGAEHTCALRPNGQVRCWGRGDNGQLGNRAYSGSNFPTASFNIDGALQVSAGNFHTCALMGDNRARCWGLNAQGQLGTGNTSNANQPMAVSNLVDVTHISAGGNHTCARTSPGLVRCWGFNAQGQLGGGNLTSTLSKIAVQNQGGGNFDQVVDISLGNNHSCALRTSGEVWCWGLNDKSQLGVSGTQGATTPRQVFNLPATRRISAGYDHTCALTLDGDVYCWGRNDRGQLGRGSTGLAGLAQRVHLPADAVDVAAGWLHTCAALVNGTTHCWGANERGQLSKPSPPRETPTAADETSPVLVPELTDVYRVAAGRYHSCALTISGDAFCWGAAENGQLGDGTQGDTNNEHVTPVQVAP
ncbi:hypothetical protein DV096_11360 [Bradymonadaceae bacterium TMQ3]|uniref:RCC1-like domain-containing protein n=1 Tax=Lujinxingia sediminis TaxID=2480984 RepID=A0ABY0CRB5_9DELT|nr:hypothetical protein [Lujinxingia sediminis]RDV37712.1 hypothetical protein DV096_11360 [Bradymonadaceae bacterium TMQ3]RVU43119.1 hypothetical protein EA187_12960 [Lujinxingia sediminis]TXC75505.1 hypothetical protein FRC91_12395 [Bradymonadales bacterium TMQ1]